VELMGENLNESRIAYLFEAVRCGTVRAAAEYLDVAPSAVSRQIALLEAEVGVSLVERHRRGICATEAGALLVDYYREQRSHQSDLLSKLQEISGLRRGSVRVLMGEGFVSTMAAGPVMAFHQGHPEISVSVDICGTSDIMRRIAEDEAEIGVVFNPPPDPKVVSRAGSRQPMHAVVGPGFPLAGGGNSVTLRDLMPYPIALAHPSYGTRQLVEAAMLLDKVRLVPAITTNSIAVLKQFAKTGSGFTLLAPLAVAPELESGELIAIPVDNPILQRPETHVVTRIGRMLSPAANRLLQMLCRRMQQYPSNVPWTQSNPNLPKHP